MHYLRFHIEAQKIRGMIPPLDILERKIFLIFKIIVIIVLILLILVLAYVLVYSILVPDETYSVQPFETIDNRENLNGNALATFLKFDIQNIKNIYEPTLLSDMHVPKSQTFSPLWDIKSHMPIEMEKMKLDYRLSQLGTIGAEGVSFSIGNAILLMKEFLGRQQNTITCSLQQYNSTIILVAIIMDNKNRTALTVKHESIKSAHDQIPYSIEDLAFKIVLELCRRSKEAVDLYPTKWETFKRVTQARDAYKKYVLTKDSKFIDYGYNMTMLAKKIEPKYKGTYEMLYGLGLCYMQCKNYSMAEIIFQDIYNYTPYDRGLEYLGVLGLGQNEFDIGFDKKDNNYYKKALPHIERANQLKPNESAGFNTKGWILFEMKENKKAIKAFEMAIELEPNSGRAWYGKGLALNASGNYEEAIQAYESAIYQNRQNAEYWYYEGFALKALGKYDEARKYYNKSIELDPGLENRTDYINNDLPKSGKY